ncbi:S24 family peptidase [Methylobacter sp. Wu1]|uniref:XRE family transcriptional regulator n=1 Tax=Methylobacter sp. Wu1 TaxID=3119359 RepID=UPI002F94968A
MITTTLEEHNSDDVGVSDSNSDTFAERIDEIVNEFGGNSEFARICGFSEGIVRNWRKGDSDPSRKKLIVIADAFNLNYEWLLTGNGPKYRGDKEPITGAIESDDYLYIPLYDVRASAGHGAWNDSENIKCYLAFRREWIQHELGGASDQLCLVYVAGESMETALHDNDVVMVDLSSKELVTEGIYALIMDGRFLLKRLQILPGKKISISSDNKAYQSFIVEDGLDSPDLYLVGRAVWIGRKL